MFGKDKVLLKEERTPEFLTKQWCGVPHDWALKYWKGMNAFNSSHEGVSADDYIECWIMWDKMAMDFYTKECGDYRFNPENPEKPKGADFAEQQASIVNDSFNKWKNEDTED